MSVSYAGINLPTITRELAERIERYISTQDLYPWDFSLPGQGRLGFTHAAERWRTRPPRLGRLSWPSGASRWATAFFVVDSASLASIREVVYAGGKYVPADLFMTHDDENATAGITASMYMLPARPLIGVAPGDLWLLVLVDQRYFWWQARSGNLSVADGTSWASLYTTLGNLLPGRPSITPDTISSDYQTAPAWFSATDEHIPPLLDSVAKCVGQQIVCGLDGTIHAYGYTSSRSIQQSNLAEELDILAGGELNLAAGGDTPGFLPQAVQVDFPQVQNGGYSGKVSSSTQALSSLGFLSDVQTNADTRVLFHPFSAQLAAGGSWTNQTACQTLAKAYATSYYQSLTSAEDRVLAGIVDWTPEGLEDWIEWTFTAEMCSTRIQRLPHITPDIYLPANKAQTTTSAVLVTSATSQPISLPNGTISGYPATQQTFSISLGTWANVASAWFVGNNGEVPVANTRYNCFLLGTDNSGKQIWGETLYALAVWNIAGSPPPAAAVDKNVSVIDADARGVLSFSEIASGHVRLAVADASTTQAGVVNTTSQTFTGDKHFQGVGGSVNIYSTSQSESVILGNGDSSWYSNSFTIQDSLVGNPSGTTALNASIWNATGAGIIVSSSGTVVNSTSKFVASTSGNALSGYLSWTNNTANIEGSVVYSDNYSGTLGPGISISVTPAGTAASYTSSLLIYQNGIRFPGSVQIYDAAGGIYRSGLSGTFGG